jgi:hypothetical protein
MQSHVSTMNYYDFSESERSYHNATTSTPINASLLRKPSDDQSDDGTKTTIPSDRTGLSWWSVLWRLASGMMFSALLLLGLYFYGMKSNLDTWDRRLFNSFTLLCSALVSLSFGSMMGILGAALRWPLLARKAHSPHEVDLMLNMHNPTGTLRLLGHQIGCNKLSVTTIVALAYLIFNMAGRLGVAAFGLVYNLNENVEVQYPVMVTNFSYESDELSLRNRSLRVFNCRTDTCSGELGTAAGMCA